MFIVPFDIDGKFPSLESSSLFHFITIYVCVVAKKFQRATINLDIRARLWLTVLIDRCSWKFRSSLRGESAMLCATPLGFNGRCARPRSFGEAREQRQYIIYVQDFILRAFPIMYSCDSTVDFCDFRLSCVRGASEELVSEELASLSKTPLAHAASLNVGIWLFLT